MNALVALTKKKIVAGVKKPELDLIVKNLSDLGLMPAASSLAYCYLLVDHSQSMELFEKMSQAKEGAKDFATDAMEKGYKVGLIKFSTKAIHLCEPIDDVSELKSIIEGIETDNFTNMAQAIQIARDKLKDEIGQRVIVIITDGWPDNKERALLEAEQAKSLGIDIITVGTDAADEEFLKLIASRKELAEKVSTKLFGQGIREAAKKLPLLIAY